MYTYALARVFKVSKVARIHIHARPNDKHAVSSRNCSHSVKERPRSVVGARARFYFYIAGLGLLLITRSVVESFCELLEVMLYISECK